MRLLTLVCLVLLLGNGCVPAQNQLPEAEKQVVREHVLRVLEESRAGVSQADPTLIFKDLMAGEEAVFINQGGFHASRDSVIASTYRALKWVSSQAMHVETQAVYVLSATAGVVSEHGTYTSVLKTGQEVSSPYSLTLVIAQVGGVWQIIHGHQSFPNSP